jgi:phytanoyl-CoA hydroxylase
MNNSLNQYQVRFFHDTGYLTCPNVLTQKEVASIKSELEKMFDNAEEPYKRNQEGEIVRLYSISERSDNAFGIAQHPEIISRLTGILGPNIVLVRNRHNHTCLNLKGKNPSDRFHRDVLQWSRPIVTVIIYLEDSNEANGATRVIPTSHYLPFSGEPDVGGTYLDENREYAGMAEQGVSVPVKSGGILIMNSSTLHCSGENKGDGSRLSLTFGYRSIDDLETASDPAGILVSGNSIQRGHSFTKSK